jgi:hypothetical protein
MLSFLFFLLVYIIIGHCWLRFSVDVAGDELAKMTAKQKLCVKTFVFVLWPIAMIAGFIIASIQIIKG